MKGSTAGSMLGIALGLSLALTACAQQPTAPSGNPLAASVTSQDAKGGAVLSGTVSLSATGGTYTDPVAETTGDEYCAGVNVLVSWTYDDGVAETTAPPYGYGSLDVHFNGVEFAEDNTNGLDGLIEGDSFSITTTHNTPVGGGTFTAGGMGKDAPGSKKPTTYHTAPASVVYGGCSAT